jgi:hypothetical protein
VFCFKLFFLTNNLKSYGEDLPLMPQRGSGSGAGGAGVTGNENEYLNVGLRFETSPPGEYYKCYKNDLSALNSIV